MLANLGIMLIMLLVVLGAFLIWCALEIIQIIYRKDFRMSLSNAIKHFKWRFLNQLKLNSKCPRCTRVVYTRIGTLGQKASGMIFGKSRFICPDCKIIWKRSGWKSFK